MAPVTAEFAAELLESTSMKTTPLPAPTGCPFGRQEALTTMVNMDLTDQKPGR